MDKIIYNRQGNFAYINCLTVLVLPFYNFHKLCLHREVSFQFGSKRGETKALFTLDSNKREMYSNKAKTMKYWNNQH